MTESGALGVTSYGWDLNGNMVSKTGPGGAWTYEWDYDNKLKVAEKDGLVRARYGYDFGGARIWRGEETGGTRFLVDGNNQTGYSQTLREVGVNGDVSYTFGDDLLSQRRDGAGPAFYHYDGLGSTRALSSPAGVATDFVDYLAFGEILSKTGTTDLSHLYTGEYLDPNLGYYYLRARLYDPGIGRFASLDPFGGVYAAPSSLHKYLYVSNNPLNSTDHSGLINWPLVAVLVAAMIVTELAILLGEGLYVMYKNSKAISSNVLGNRSKQLEMLEFICSDEFIIFTNYFPYSGLGLLFEKAIEVSDGKIHGFHGGLHLAALMIQPFPGAGVGQFTPDGFYLLNAQEEDRRSDCVNLATRNCFPDIETGGATTDKAYHYVYAVYGTSMVEGYIGDNALIIATIANLFQETTGDSSWADLIVTQKGINYYLDNYSNR